MLKNSLKNPGSWSRSIEVRTFQYTFEIIQMRTGFTLAEVFALWVLLSWVLEGVCCTCVFYQHWWWWWWWWWCTASLEQPSARGGPRWQFRTHNLLHSKSSSEWRRRVARRSNIPWGSTRTAVSCVQWKLLQKLHVGTATSNLLVWNATAYASARYTFSFQFFFNRPNN